MTNSDLGTEKLGPSGLRYTNNLAGTKDRALHMADSHYFMDDGWTGWAKNYWIHPVYEVNQDSILFIGLIRNRLLLYSFLAG